MARTRGGRHWMQEHLSDEYVQRAQKEGHRARAIYKLMEMDERDRIIKPGHYVVDLGAAPGSWSEYAAGKVGKNGRVFALDLLDIEPIDGVEFIQGDFRSDEVLDQLMSLIENHKIDLVMSDMAPNISGMKAVDQPRAMYLAELSLELAKTVLKPGGDLLIKIFNGEGLDEFKKLLKADFDKLLIRKPKASRARSRENYLLARGYNV